MREVMVILSLAVIIFCTCSKARVETSKFILYTVNGISVDSINAIDTVMPVTKDVNELP